MIDAEYIVVGSGFSGCVMAERIASQLGKKVVLLDKRPLPGGNSRSEFDPVTGIECHLYGSHIFHTAREEVWGYINRFSSFTSYCHKVLVRTGDLTTFLPVNRRTLEDLLGKNLTQDEVKDLLAIPEEGANTLSSAHLQKTPLGRKLYDLFFLPYTRKQWGREPSQLPPHILARLPIRINDDTSYFSDPFQGVPKEGYGKLFANLLKDPLITFLPETDFAAVKGQISPHAKVIYTGPIDEYFDFSLGRLAYRSCRFEMETLSIQDFQGTSVVNYPEEKYAFTRIHEFKHFHPERHTVFAQDQTIICREYPQAHTQGNPPLYPVNTEKDQQLYKSYLALAEKEKNLFFCGRLGCYQYWNMDEAIYRALRLFETEIRKSAFI